MSTYEFLGLLDELIRSLKPDSELDRMLNAIAVNLQQTTEYINQAVASSDPNTTQHNIQQLQTNLNAVVNHIRIQGPGSLYIQLNDLERQLRLINTHSELAEVHIENPVKVLVDATKMVFHAYDEFIKESTPSRTVRLMEVASSFITVTSFAREFLVDLRSMLIPPAEVSPDEREVSMFLSGITDFSEVLTKLRAVQEIYDELSQLFEVSTSQHPLRVIKLETGSLWLRLVGESRVIGLLISLVERSVSFMHRNYTDEGKLASLPRQVEAAEAILRLSEQLEAANCDTSRMKENLEKSAVIISQRLNDLLVREPRVVINGKEFSVGHELEEKFLRESRMLFLEPADQTDETSDE